VKFRLAATKQHIVKDRTVAIPDDLSDRCQKPLYSVTHEANEGDLCGKAAQAFTVSSYVSQIEGNG
jgi:hypothetical protein